MSEYTYNFTFEPAEPKGSRVRGIASRPEEKDGDNVPSLMDTFYESLSSFFSSTDEAKRVLSSKSAEEVDVSTVYDEYEAALSLNPEPVRTLETVDDLGELALRSSEEASLYRMEQGITDAKGSLGDTITQGIEDRGLMTSPRPQARPVEETPTTEPDATQELLDRIAFGEGADPSKLQAQEKHGIGTTPYDMVYNYGNTLAPSKPVTEMTMQELYDYQTDLIAATKGQIPGTNSGTSAAGKYQVIRKSLFGSGTPDAPMKNSWADKLGLKADTVYTPEIQEEIGMLALKEAGYNSFIRGGRSRNSFHNKIANIWASVARSDGSDTYGQGIHTNLSDLQPMYDLLKPTKPEPLETSLRPVSRPRGLMSQ